MPRRFLLDSCVLLLMDGAAPRLFILAGETRLDRSHVRPNRHSTAFRLASPSKTVTAAAIVMLIGRGGVGVGSHHTCFKSHGQCQSTSSPLWVRVAHGWSHSCRRLVRYDLTLQS